MFERGYCIGRRSVFNGHGCLFASVRAFKCVPGVIPRRHSRSDWTHSVDSRGLFSLSTPRRTDRVGPGIQQRSALLGSTFVVVKWKTVSTRRSSRHGRERPWISSKLLSPEHGADFRFLLSRLILLSTGEIYLITHRGTE